MCFPVAEFKHYYQLYRGVIEEICHHSLYELLFMIRIPPNHLPSSSSLRAFHAASRHLSYTAAARDLNITQSAISHQIRALEVFWDIKLFERSGRTLRLTAAGEVLAPLVVRFFVDLSGALVNLHEPPARTVLRVSTVQSFANKWLVPRLPDFQVLHTDVDVWISTHDDFVTFGPTSATDRADVAIRLCRGNVNDSTRDPTSYLEMTPLLHEEVFPVCSPDFVTTWGLPEQPEDLRGLPLVLRHDNRGLPTWRDWFTHVGITDIPLDQGISYSDSTMAIQVALEGQGIALVRSVHLSDELEQGKLIRLFQISYPSPMQYHFVCHKDRAGEPAIRDFRTWIIAKSKITQAGFNN